MSSSNNASSNSDSNHHQNHRKAGRPRALDDAKRREICALVSMGSSLEGAARYVGCAVSTIRREALRNDEFNDALRRSAFSAEVMPLQQMREFAKKYWRASAWLLERMDPQRFGKQNVRFLKPEDLQHYMQMLSELLKGEIRNPDDYQRVVSKLADLAKKAKRESWADRDTSPRRRQRKPRRKHTQFNFPPDDPRANERKPTTDNGERV